ncbi:MAG: hypothetical protein GKR89_17035 [Candidatus Latescibacteria bacterium]|nr:hypothetical protein [Candidatus Latescibacterota bacterium]
MAEKSAGVILDIRGRLGANKALDELQRQFALGDGESQAASACLQDSLEAFGEEDVVRELVRRLEGLQGEEDAAAYFWALGQLGGESVLRALYKLVGENRLPPRLRKEAALVLQAVEAPVALENLSQAEAAGLQQVLQRILQEAQKQVGQAEADERVFALNEFFVQICRSAGRESDLALMGTLVEALKAQQSRVATEMLWAVSQFGVEQALRDQAASSLEGLLVDPALSGSLFEGRFVRAYSSPVNASVRQGQLLIVWERSPDRLLIFSFLFDHAFWGGGLKEFFVRPGVDEEEFDQLLEMYEQHDSGLVPIQAATARALVLEGLQANRDHSRPLPRDYRRYNALLACTLFGGSLPLEPPPLDEEAHSPLPDKAGQVEELLGEQMPAAGFSPEQVVNGRMLWRDFYQTHQPRIGKTGVWAAAVEYAIGWIEGWSEQTQQVVGRHYGVSPASVSNRFGELWDRFLDVEQDTIAYTTDRIWSQTVGEGVDWLQGDLAAGEGASLAGELESDYQEYLEEYDLSGAGLRCLERAEFEHLTEEFYGLAALEETQELSQRQLRRLEKLEHLLLLD